MRQLKGYKRSIAATQMNREVRHGRAAWHESEDRGWLLRPLPTQPAMVIPAQVASVSAASHHSVSAALAAMMGNMPMVAASTPAQMARA